MVATSINIEPNPTAEAVICAAYRPLGYAVISDSAVDPDLIMYADVYIGFGTFSPDYYKTFAATTIDYVGPYARYIFDVQDAAQEFIKTKFSGLPISDIVTMSQQMAYIVVYFRGSTITGGVLVPEGPVPVQGTLTTPPVSGGGLASNGYYVLNASLSPYSAGDILANNIEANLSAYQRLFVACTYPVNPDSRIYGLSNFPLARGGRSSTIVDPTIALNTYKPDMGGIPIIIVAFPPYGLYSPFHRNCYSGIAVVHNGVGVSFFTTSSTITRSAGIHYLPFGMREIYDAAVTYYGGTSFANALFNPSNDYYLQAFLVDADSGDTVYASQYIKPVMSTIERKRMAFVNTYGQYEYITFVRNSENFKTVSANQFVPNFINYSRDNAMGMGHVRNKISAADEITLTGVFPEACLPWLKELFMSSRVFIINDESGVLQLTTPVMVLDATYDTKKSISGGVRLYEVTIKVRPAQDYIALRN